MSYWRAVNATKYKKTRGVIPRVFARLTNESLSFDRQFDVHRTLLLIERAPQLRQRNVLKLTNALPGYTKLFANFLESLWFATIETEALEDDFLLTIIQNIEQTANLIAQVFV